LFDTDALRSADAGDEPLQQAVAWDLIGEHMRAARA
jgi:hypothetical protein